MTDKIYAYVVDGLVIEVVKIDAELVPGKDVYTQEYANGLVDVTAASPMPAQFWTYDGKKFSPPVIAAAQKPDPTSLAPTVIDAATRACDAVTQQIIPDATHQQAYQNAATIVWGSGGKAPTADPAKSVFAGQAKALGLSVDTFAGVVSAVSLLSLQLATLLSTLRAGASDATTIDQLNGALTAFEAGLSGLVGSLNAAGLTVAVKAPDPILIAGLNA